MNGNPLYFVTLAFHVMKCQLMGNQFTFSYPLEIMLLAPVTNLDLDTNAGSRRDALWMGMLATFFFLSLLKNEATSRVMSTMLTICLKLADRASSTNRSMWVSTPVDDIVMMTLSAESK